MSVAPPSKKNEGKGSAAPDQVRGEEQKMSMFSVLLVVVLVCQSGAVTSTVEENPLRFIRCDRATTHIGL